MVAQPIIRSVNPTTEEVVAMFEPFTPQEIDQRLGDAQAAFLAWRDVSFGERSALMRRAAAYLRTHTASLAGLITLEMGKPIVEAEAEVQKCAWNCDYYAEHAAQFLADEPRQSSAAASYVAFDPLGPVLAIMPWNFPFWQVFRFAAPALMAGNTAVLKHASNVSQCALAIEQVFAACDFPAGIFQTLLLPGQAADAIIADPRIAAVTLTGSSAAGLAVGTAAGRAVKKSVLELGGSDPFVVLEDADLAAAARMAVRSRYQNCGQSCIAAKRIIVVQTVAGPFLEQFVELVRGLRVGDPTDRAAQVGPMARGDLREAIDRQIRASVERGARLVVGGERLSRRGYFFAPTVLADVSPDMVAFCEETFGPVAAITTARDADEAIDLANSTWYGLGANLWTRDLDRARRLARRIEAGSVFVNGMVASDPRLPFGGVKRSGYGRELSEFGIREFTNIKTIWIGPGGQPPAPQPQTAVE